MKALLYQDKHCKKVHGQTDVLNTADNDMCFGPVFGFGNDAVKSYKVVKA